MIIKLLYGLITIKHCQHKQKGQQGRGKYLKDPMRTKLQQENSLKCRKRQWIKPQLVLDFILFVKRMKEVL